MDKSLDKIIKRHVVLTALTGVAVVLLMVTVTYGLYQVNHENTSDQEISLGDFNVDLTSTSGQITLSNLNPGVENETTYTFTTSNTGDYVVKYNVYFTDNTTTFLADSTNAQTYSNYSQITSENYQYIEYKLDTGEYKPLSSVYTSTTKRFTIITGRLQPNISYNHSVKFRVSPTAPNNIQGSILALNITMEASATTEVGSDTIMNLVAGEPTNTTDVITKSAPQGATCTNTLAYDGTVDNNLRYVGLNPCNYVTFNDETAGWRIIGVMNNIDDGTGKKETRVKLVRKDSLGSYSWDTSAAEINSGRGVNDWSQADLMQELNGDYLDTTLVANTSWYSGSNNTKTGVYNYTKGLKSSAQNFIGNSKWYLGGFLSTMENFMSSNLYKLERGSTAWGSDGTQICNDGYCPRSLNWTGKVALIYPSDYVYATAGGSGASRNSCLNSLSPFNDATAQTWINTSYTDCINNDWLKDSSWKWTLSANSGDPFYSFRITSGYVGRYHSYAVGMVHPSVYLLSQVKISSGEGTESSPYILS